MDVLVNNAGISQRATVLDTSQAWRAVERECEEVFVGAKKAVFARLKR